MCPLLGTEHQICIHLIFKFVCFLETQALHHWHAYEDATIFNLVLKRSQIGMTMLPLVEPTLKMTRSDSFGLMSLAKANLRDSPDISSFLIGEIGRAALVERDKTQNVVTMNSCVEFYYRLTGQRRTVRLVYPPEADVAEGKISVMTPIGAALIGLSKGQSIEWRTSRGVHRFLKVLEVNNDTNSYERNP